MKTTLRVLLIFALLVAVLYGGLVWHNNREVPAPTRAELTQRLDKAIHWLEINRWDFLTADTNLLWWMVVRGAAATSDPRLLAITKPYVDAYNSDLPTSVWSHLFDPDSAAVPPPTIPPIWDYYHSFIAYGLTCDAALGHDPLVEMQRQPDFCLRHHPISPACITHQLMGARLVRDNRCDDSQSTEVLVRSLQDTIVTQLTFDPRLIDVYLQRVMELAESGAAQRIKPRWVRRVLDAQLADGGWGGDQALFPLGDQANLCFTARVIGICRENSNFHATSQAILLLSLLTKQSGQ